MIGKSQVSLLIDSLQSHDARTMIERTRLRRKHQSHHVTLGTRKHEVGVMTILYSLTQTRLNGFLWIVGYRLKLIYRNQARFICLFEISEDLVQGNFWCLYITNANTPLRISIDIKGDS